MTSTTRKRQKQQARRLPRGPLYGAALLLVVGAAYVLLRAGLPGFGRSDTQDAPAQEEAAFPPLVVERFDGGQFDLQRDHGQATVLFAMAYWCGTCIPETQALAALQNEMGAQGLVVVPIDIDPTSTPEALSRFIDFAGASNLTFAYDTGGAFVQTFNVRVLDTTIILDGSGNEVYRDQSPTSYDTLRAELEQVLGL